MINWYDVPNESPNKDLALKNLKVTQNGTYGESGVAYSSVEVNVSGGGGGSSDFTTAEVTVINNSGDNIRLLNFAFVYTDHDDDPIGNDLTVNANSTLIVNAVFYKNNPSSGVLHNYNSGVYSLNFSGNIEDDGDGYFIINGAGTITVEEIIQ